MGCTVKGVLVTGLTDGDLRRLDFFEGSQYDREVVSVELPAKDGSSKSSSITAEVYVFNEVEYLEEDEWSFEEFRRDKLLNWVGGMGEDEYAGQ